MDEREIEILEHINRERKKQKIIKYSIIAAVILLSVIILFLTLKSKASKNSENFNATIFNNSITIGQGATISINAPKNDNISSYAFIGDYEEYIGSCVSNGKCELNFTPQKVGLYTVVIKDGNMTKYLPLEVNPLIPSITPPSIS